MDGNIAVTYTLIYRFLKQQSQNKAAEAVKKAAKAFVILRDDIEQQGPPLEDIVKEWKAKENTKFGDADSSSEDSESSDDTSSDSEDSSSSDSSSEDTSDSESEGDDTSDSDDSSDKSGEGTIIAKKLSQKAVERDTSVTLSSAGENAREVVKQVAQIPEKKSTKGTDKATKDKNKGSESNSSDSDSSDSDSSSKSSASDGSGAEPSSSSSSSSSSSDSSDEDEPDSESQQKEDTRVAKKRKTSEKGAAVTTAVATGLQPIVARVSQRKEKPPPKVKERFQRVKVQNLAPEHLLNNGFEARGGAMNDYGERAHRDLIVTRGAGFRKEKNKKKRGSYRGGEITMENHSIKFVL